VTGGLGFIGSNLALALARAGAEVTVIDARYPRHGANSRNLDGPGSDAITIVEADLGDRAVRAPAARAEIVFNLAGQVSHLDSMTDPMFDLDVNARSQAAFLETLRGASPDAVVVYTSTRQLFGRPRYLPVDEEHPVSPVDVNGISKYAAEQLHLLYTTVYGLRSVVVRLTNVYGPRQRLRDDYQGFLPIFLRRALLDQTISIFGDGSQERDCLHVDDVVDCLVRAALAVERQGDEANGQVFNVGNDEHLALRDIAAEIVTATGMGRLDFVPWPPDRDAIDVGSYFGDSSKAKRVLGWEPRVRFAEGIRATVEFYRAHLEWYL
jgi:nucleoside-diphosphate-sugar epimerase